MIFYDGKQFWKRMEKNCPDTGSVGVKKLGEATLTDALQFYSLYYIHKRKEEQMSVTNIFILNLNAMINHSSDENLYYFFIPTKTQ